MSAANSGESLRIGVVGAGMMGADHIRRINQRIVGAHVSAIIEPDEARGAQAMADAPGSKWFSRLEYALEAWAMDAVLIATPGRFHAPVLIPAIEARLPILCEKPLTQDSETSWDILQREQELDKPHIQVGFMRRFDHEYQELRQLIESREAGELLMLRGVHRNPSVPPEGYTQEMLITDSVVHEFDVIPWLAGERIESVEVKFPKRNSLTPEHLSEPILVLMTLADGTLVDVEMNVSVQFGYQVATEAVFEQGIARIGQPSGLQRWQAGTFQMQDHMSFVTRFSQAYDTQVQRWVNAVRRGDLVDGPNAWDGYLVALACEAGVRALNEGGIIPVQAVDRPAFYAGT